MSARFSSISHNMNQFKLQNRIFKRILSSKGANFAARFARIFYLCPPPNLFLAPRLPPQNSGAGSATGYCTLVRRKRLPKGILCGKPLLMNPQERFQKLKEHFKGSKILFGEQNKVPPKCL